MACLARLVGTRNTPQLTQEHSNSLVFVEGRAGAGSGFVCDIGGKKFVITNQHVVAGNAEAKFTLLDQSPIRTGRPRYPRHAVLRRRASVILFPNDDITRRSR